MTYPLPSQRLESEIKYIRKINFSNIPILLVGTKLDLSDKIVVRDDEAMEFRTKHNLLDYIKVSAKTGEYIKKAYDILIKDILAKKI